MGREGTKKPKTQKCRVSVKREEHVHEQGVLFGPSGKVFGCEYIRNPLNLGDNLCGSGWEAPSTGVNVHDHVAEEKSPISVCYSQHPHFPPYCHVQGRGEGIR